MARLAGKAWSKAKPANAWKAGRDARAGDLAASNGARMKPSRGYDHPGTRNGYLGFRAARSSP